MLTTADDQARIRVITDLRRRSSSVELADGLFTALVDPKGWSEPKPGPIRHRAKRRCRRAVR